MLTLRAFMDSIKDWFLAASVEKMAALSAVVGFLAFAVARAFSAFRRAWLRGEEADADQWLSAIEDVASSQGGTVCDVRFDVKTRRDRRRARVLVGRGVASLKGDTLTIKLDPVADVLSSLPLAWRY